MKGEKRYAKITPYILVRTPLFLMERKNKKKSNKNLLELTYKLTYETIINQ